MNETNKQPTPPNLTLIGSREGLPALDDVIALYKHLTGKDPSPEELASAKTRMDAIRARQQ